MQFDPGDGLNPRTGELEPEMDLKLTVMEIYNCRLTQRVERKKVVFEHNLLDYRENNKIEKKRTKDERDLLNKAKPFARMMNHDDFESFCQGLVDELNCALTSSAETLELIRIPMWEPMGFGLGVSVVTDPEKLGFLGKGGKGAFGWPGAFGTWWQADPANGMIVIYLIQNSMPLGAGAVAQMADMRQARARLALPMFQSMVYGALV